MIPNLLPRSGYIYELPNSELPRWDPYPWHLSFIFTFSILYTLDRYLTCSIQHWMARYNQPCWVGASFRPTRTNKTARYVAYHMLFRAKWNDKFSVSIIQVPWVQILNSGLIYFRLVRGWSNPIRLTLTISFDTFISKWLRWTPDLHIRLVLKSEFKWWIRTSVLLG